jgi:poly-gamma-glutamate capsule biosynthesis protein CapA/YwtB (metallophosphatase superfamily)
VHVGVCIHPAVLVALALGMVGCGRKGEGRWISQLEIAPRLVLIQQHESTRISFVIRDRGAAAAGFARIAVPRLRSVEAYAAAVGWRLGGARRDFVWRAPVPGYRLAVWDGTLVGQRNQPPATGLYRIRVSVTDERGYTEQASRHILVLNPGQRAVLPRTQSGLALRSLEFDGTHAVLTDQAGNGIRVRAVSGLKPNNPINPRHVDYTQPVHQWTSERGPIPAGEYFIRKNDVQQPDVRSGQLLYPTGFPLADWGPMRVLLHPFEIGDRGDFFFHLDSSADGTAGCIGVHPSEEGRFNQMMALIAWMPNDTLKVTVRYSSALQQRPARDTLRLYAVGNVNLGGRLAEDYRATGDLLFPFRKLLDTFRDVDVLFANLESPIAPRPGVEAPRSVFTAPPAAAAALARAGFDVVSTANDHAWDAGSLGLLETIDRLDRNGVQPVGTGVGRPLAQAPVVLRRRGWRVAFFAVTRVFNPPAESFQAHEAADYIAWGDTAWLYPALRELRASGRADLVVVSVHGGEEYADQPAPEHLAFLQGLVDAGADLVLGHHPQVLQPVVWHRSRPIIPSLGKFIFPQQDPRAQVSAIVRIDVAPDRTMRLSAIPIRAGEQPRLADRPTRDSVGARLRLSASSIVARP